MKLHFSLKNGPVDEMIENLITAAGGISRPGYVREMIIASLKAGQEDEKSADLKLMNSTLKEMRFTSKVFGAYRNFRKITVFGSARTHPDEPIYRIAESFGRKLAESGFMVISGGGGGIMAAVLEGAGPNRAFEVHIRLPFEEMPQTAAIHDPRSITYKYFFNRKVAFLKEADAVALFPGGFGTLDEAMETLTLLQTGKRNPMPLLLVDDPEHPYWDSIIELIRTELLSRNYICLSDLSLFDRVFSADAAVEKIRHFYRRYHSIRYVGGRLVIRITSGLSPEAIGMLADRFHDILAPGGEIAISEALEAEKDDADIMQLPRLLVDFNRKKFGRLKEMIDFINDL